MNERIPGGWITAIRLLAVYGLVSFPVMWLLGVASSVSPAVRTWIDAPAHAVPLQVWGVSVVVTLLVTFGVAVRTVARDKEMSGGARAAWIVALVMANLAAGAVFVLARVRRPVRNDRFPDARERPARRERERPAA
ncbi:MAG TPA: hypothetical protein VFJ82_07355 [Longimicrobium sp.]|nr:hypothetical protein [Longimicrobium sp.]